METIKLKERFDGHIILYCKGHYDVANVDFFEGLKNIWSARCGVQINDSAYQYIASHLVELINHVSPQKMNYLFDGLHKTLCDKPVFQYEIDDESTPIQKCIKHYVNMLRDLQVNDRDTNGKVYPLIELPKPQKELFRKIVKEGYKGGEYEQVIG